MKEIFGFPKPTISFMLLYSFMILHVCFLDRVEPAGGQHHVDEAIAGSADVFEDPGS